MIPNENFQKYFFFLIILLFSNEIQFLMFWNFVEIGNQFVNSCREGNLEMVQRLISKVDQNAKEVCLKFFFFFSPTT